MTDLQSLSNFSNNFNNPRNIKGLSKIFANSNEDGVDYEEIERSILDTSILTKKKDTNSTDIRSNTVDYTKKWESSISNISNTNLSKRDNDRQNNSGGGLSSNLEKIFSSNSYGGDDDDDTTTDGTKVLNLGKDRYSEDNLTSGGGGMTSGGGMTGGGLTSGGGMTSGGMTLGGGGSWWRSESMTSSVPTKNSYTGINTSSLAANTYYGTDEKSNLFRDNHLNNITDEQRKRQHISDITNRYFSNNRDSRDKDEYKMISEEDEAEELAQIQETANQLISLLENEGVDISKVPDVNRPHISVQEAKKILRVLQIKNDRLRYSDLFEEVILAGCYALEIAFDGENEYFGKKVDLRGYSNTMKIKLKRCKYDTSSFVGNIMRTHEISHGTRIFMELVPSIFLFSRGRIKSKTTTTVPDSEFTDSLQNINKAS